MNSQFRVFFATTSMYHVKNTVLQDEPNVSFICCCYVDDILVDITGQEIVQLKQEVSWLSFTVEKSVENTSPFLDVSIGTSDGEIIVHVYRKPADACHCLSGECSDRYDCGQDLMSTVL